MIVLSKVHLINNKINRYDYRVNSRFLELLIDESLSKDKFEDIYNQLGNGEEIVAIRIPRELLGEKIGLGADFSRRDREEIDEHLKVIKMGIRFANFIYNHTGRVISLIVPINSIYPKDINELNDCKMEYNFLFDCTVIQNFINANHLNVKVLVENPKNIKYNDVYSYGYNLKYVDKINKLKFPNFGVSFNIDNYLSLFEESKFTEFDLKAVLTKALKELKKHLNYLVIDDYKNSLDDDEKFKIICSVLRCKLKNVEICLKYKNSFNSLGRVNNNLAF